MKFTWKGGSTNFENNYGEDFGFIAQDIEKVIPEVVFNSESGYLKLEYGKLVAIGIGSIQEQNTRIENIKDRINILKSKILNG